jgi:DNA-directed RNA polymerase specialized sigma subunit
MTPARDPLVPASPDNTLEDDLADDLYYKACKAGLTPKEMTVYDLLYRLGWSLVLVGKVMGVSDSRIGQHRDQIAKKMRRILVC